MVLNQTLKREGWFQPADLKKGSQNFKKMNGFKPDLKKERMVFNQTLKRRMDLHQI